MTIRPGEFWVAAIPFTSGTTSKKRPVLVLWLESQDAVVAAVTSAKPRSQTDVSRSPARPGNAKAEAPPPLPRGRASFPSLPGETW
jgi:hypothetical protein